MNGQIDTNTAN